MAYRRTKDVIARLDAKRDRILLSAINLADKESFDKLTVHAVAEAAHVSVGTVYSHFADWAEVMANIVALHLRSDLNAMQAPAGFSPKTAFEHALESYIRQHAKKRRGRQVSDEPVYRAGVVNFWGRLIEVAGVVDQQTAATLATGLYGAFNAVIALRQRVDAKTEQVLISMALRAIGAAPKVRVAA